MKLAKYQVPPKARGRDLDLTLPPGASWVRFGNDVLLYGEEAKWKGLTDRARKGKLQKQERVSTVKKERLHIVVQNGRLFSAGAPKSLSSSIAGAFCWLSSIRSSAPARRKSPTCYGVLPR